MPQGNCEYIHNVWHLIDTLEDKLPWSVRINIIKQASSGLAYLHKKKIVYCDVKAGNIFIGDNSNCIIAKIGHFRQAFFDFGQFSVSQATTYSRLQTSKEDKRNRLGTLPYSAPEIFNVVNIDRVIYTASQW